MKKNYAYLFVMVLLAFGANTISAQCIPTGVSTVFGTVTGSTGTQTFNNMPTGNVVRITVPAIGTYYNISMCQTNGGVAQLDGIDDSQLTILDVNSASAISIGFNDDFCPTTGANGYGPSEVNYTATATGDIFVYLTEWNVAGTTPCIADGTNTSYTMTVTKTAAPPVCNAGVLTTTGSPFSICPSDSFTVSTDGTETTAGGFGIFLSPQATGSGGLGGPFNFTNVTLPYIGDNDLNGVLTNNSFPVLSGEWAIYTIAYSDPANATGTICSTSADSIIVNFLSSTDSACIPAGNNLALENTVIASANKQEVGGFIPNFVVDYTERTSVVMSVDVRNTATTSVSSFVIESTVSNGDGTVTDVVNQTVNTTIAAGGVYTYSMPAKNLTTLFPAQAADEILFIEHNLLSSASNATIDANDTALNFIAAPIGSLIVPYSSSFEILDAADAADFDQNTWGWKYIDNDNDGNTFGPYSFGNVPTQTGDHCLIGSIINGNQLSLGAIDETVQSPNLSLNAATTYDFSIYAYTLAGQTGAVDMVLTDEGGTFTTTLGTITIGANDTVPTKFTFSGTVPATANDYLVNINKSASNFIFLDLFEIVEDTTSSACSSGVLSTVGFPLNFCPGDSFIIATDGTESTNGDYFMTFSPQAGATGANGGIFSLTGVTFPYTGNEGLNGVLAVNGVPDLSGNWAIYTGARDTIGGTSTFCSISTDSVIINFLASNDSLCSGVGTPCVTALNTYNDLVTAGGAPCDDGTGCSTTDAGFSTFGIFGSEAYVLPGVQAGFDYVFDMCSGLGAGAWIPAITIVAPSGAVDTFNLGTTGTFAQNCSLPWTASESGQYLIVIHEQGVACGTQTATDNGNPTVTCGINAATCLPCIAGGLSSPSSMTVCSNSIDSIVLDGTESTPGSYSLSFDDTPGGTGGQTGGFSISVISFPYVFDNDLNGTLSFNSLPVLSGLWDVTIYNEDALGALCDSVPTTISINFLDSTDVLCGPTSNCDITAISAGTQSTCNAATNTYSQDIIVTYTNAPTTGMLDVNGQTFAIGTSPQTVTLIGLTSDGLDVNVTASFTDSTACTLTSNALFNAPASCACSITDLAAGTQSACVNTTNEYTQEVIVTYTNAPTTGMLTVNGQNFAIGTSPQTVTLIGLDSDGAVVNVSSSFTANTACNYSQNAVFTAPVSCLCPTITVGVNTTNVTNCASPNGNATATPSGGVGAYTFVWTPSSFGSGATINNIPSGTYTVIATDANGCSGTGSGTVSNTSGVNASVSAVNNVSCFAGNNGLITISPTGGTGTITYTWSDQGFASTISSRNNLIAGTYTVIVTDSAGCSVTLGPIVISQPDELVLIVDNFTNVTCNNVNDGSINVTTTGGNGGNVYSWTNGGGSNEDATSLAGGVYQLTVTDNNSCTATSNAVTISNPPVISISVDNQNDVTCNGANDGNILISATGGTGTLIYDWDNAPNNEDALNIGGGTYQLTVTDANGCSAQSSTITINEPNAIIISIDDFTNVSCFQDNNGSITASVNGGTGALNLSWTNGAGTSLSPSNLAPNSYQLTVTDANSCSETSSIVTITEPIAISANSSSTEESLSGNDGTATVTAAGGVAPYTYLWNPSGQTNSAATSLMAGTYTCTITDANMCTFIETVEVGKANSIGEVALESLIIYPNPSNGSFVISFETVNNLDFDINVINTIGKTIYSNSFDNVNGQFTKAINLENIASGVYFIEISNKDAKTIKRITINK